MTYKQFLKLFLAEPFSYTDGPFPIYPDLENMEAFLNYFTQKVKEAYEYFSADPKVHIKVSTPTEAVDLYNLPPFEMLLLQRNGADVVYFETDTVKGIIYAIVENWAKFAVIKTISDPFYAHIVFKVLQNLPLQNKNKTYPMVLHLLASELIPNRMIRPVNPTHILPLVFSSILDRNEATPPYPLIEDQATILCPLCGKETAKLEYVFPVLKSKRKKLQKRVNDQNGIKDLWNKLLEKGSGFFVCPDCANGFAECETKDGIFSVPEN